MCAGPHRMFGGGLSAGREESQMAVLVLCLALGAAIGLGAALLTLSGDPAEDAYRG